MAQASRVLLMVTQNLKASTTYPWDTNGSDRKTDSQAPQLGRESKIFLDLNGDVSSMDAKQ